ncbi:MAG: hypothetical protein AUH69_08085 [Actinobacteria bacterium 13_1_40CM_4_65_12]|nr:MAG: hypothetical protein AUH69_08085 [Actinobacteria bacterium 13_1_40CM_4_65_12]
MTQRGLVLLGHRLFQHGRFMQLRLRLIEEVGRARGFTYCCAAITPAFGPATGCCRTQMSVGRALASFTPLPRWAKRPGISIALYYGGTGAAGGSVARRPGASSAA